MMVVKVRVNNTIPGRNPPLCCTLTLHQSPCRDTRQKQNIFFRVHNKVVFFYYERSELLIDGDGKKTTQKIVRRRQPRCFYRPIIFFKTTVRTVLFFRTASCVAWTRIMCSVLSTLTLATCEQRSHLLRNVHNCNNITASLTQTEPASLLQTDPASLLQTVPAPCRAADGVAREAQRQQRLAVRREATRQRAAARRQLWREQQAAAADALQQQVDECLAFFDPEKPL